MEVSALESCEEVTPFVGAGAIQQIGSFSNRLNKRAARSIVSFMPSDSQQQDELLLDTLEHFDAITKPFRLAIFQALLQPASVSEVADNLEVPVTRLYYHINELARLGFISLVDVRKVGARTEKVYQSAGRTIRPSPKFFTDFGSEGLAATVHLVFGVAERGMSEAVRSGDFGLEPAPDEGLRRGTIGLNSVNLSDEDRSELITEIEGLTEKYRDRKDPDAPGVAFFYGVYPQEGNQL